ncbi:MAG: diphthine--ammonia ligase [Phycisphaerales bacterium]|nr:diphthine--ammonia ligase [Phycisphaerales bacterium]
MKEKAIFNWSGGKDSSIALYKTIKENQLDVMCLLTSISKQYQRISMHGVRMDLLDKQANCIGLPLIKVEIPEMPTMEVYEDAMAEVLKKLINKGASVSIFGDIFLDDLKKYREDKLAELNLKGSFPLWKLPTKILLKEFIDLGFKTIITCVNEKYLDKSFSGRIIDDGFLADLPENVDPCGENGEFHTFVFDGPIFKEPVHFTKGEIVYRKYEQPPKKNSSNYDCSVTKEKDDGKVYDSGFWYCDLLLG